MTQAYHKDVTLETWGTCRDNLPENGLDGQCERHESGKPINAIGRVEKCDCQPSYLEIRFEGIGRLFLQGIIDPRHPGTAAKRVLLASRAPQMYRLLQETLEAALPEQLRHRIERTLAEAVGNSQPKSERRTVWAHVDDESV